MRLHGSGDRPQRLERTLHAMRGDAARSPDLTEGVLSQLQAHRPFASPARLRLRRWARIVGTSTLGGLGLCAGIAATQWHAVAPALAPQRPVLTVFSSVAAEVRHEADSWRAAPGRLAVSLRPRGPRTDPRDAQVLAAVTTNVIVPVGSALGVAPPLGRDEPTADLARQVLVSGQRAIDRAERFVGSFARVDRAGAPIAPWGQTFADRLGNAAGVVPASADR